MGQAVRVGGHVLRPPPGAPHPARLRSHRRRTPHAGAGQPGAPRRDHVHPEGGLPVVAGPRDHGLGRHRPGRALPRSAPPPRLPPPGHGAGHPGPRPGGLPAAPAGRRRVPLECGGTGGGRPDPRRARRGRRRGRPDGRRRRPSAPRPGPAPAPPGRHHGPPHRSVPGGPRRGRPGTPPGGTPGRGGRIGLGQVDAAERAHGLRGAGVGWGPRRGPPPDPGPSARLAPTGGLGAAAAGARARHPRGQPAVGQPRRQRGRRASCPRAVRTRRSGGTPPGRPRHPGRRGWADTERRRAPAHRHRPGRAARRAGRPARRAHRPPRRRPRGGTAPRAGTLARGTVRGDGRPPGWPPRSGRPHRHPAGRTRGGGSACDRPPGDCTARRRPGGGGGPSGTGGTG